MAERFVLALAQVESVRFDKDANLATAGEWMSRAARLGARSIVFPEMYLTGYAVWGRLDELAEPLDGASIQRAADLARRYGLQVIVGFPERGDDGHVYNSAALISAEGVVLGSCRKTHLFGREPMFFRAGNELSVFDTALGRIGIAVCYDLEFPEVARLLAVKGARLILNPTANMEPYAQYQAVYLRSRAMENGVYVAAANTVGADDFYRYFGESAAVDPTGRVLCRAEGVEELLVAEIDLAAPPTDQNLEYLSKRRPELYTALSDTMADARDPD